MAPEHHEGGSYANLSDLKLPDKRPRKKEDPSERVKFVNFDGALDKDEIAKQFRAFFKRPLDVTFPPAGAYPWWFVGYVTRKEAEEFNRHRGLRFDYETMQILGKGERRRVVDKTKE